MVARCAGRNRRHVAQRVRQFLSRHAWLNARRLSAELARRSGAAGVAPGPFAENDRDRGGLWQRSGAVAGVQRPNWLESARVAAGARFSGIVSDHHPDEGESFLVVSARSATHAAKPVASLAWLSTHDCMACS